MIIWLTGQPGSGKTTMATKHFEMYSDWLQLDNVIHLDGDDVRNVLDNKDYSLEGRRKNIQFAIDMARVLHDKDYVVICSFVSPYRDMREKLKEMSKVKEFYLHSTRELRKEHWVKDYEPPLENFTEINTDKSEEETLDEILNVCREVATLS